MNGGLRVIRSILEAKKAISAIGKWFDEKLKKHQNHRRI
jgi:hypothetical protein